MRQITDWAAVDWHESNEQIAERTGAAITTIIKCRTLYGHRSSAPRKPRKDIGTSKPQCAPKSKAGQPMATAAAKASPRAGRGPDNVHALEWRLVAPDGTLHVARNLYDFVRSNPGLFAPGDVEWKRLGGERGTGGEYCNATAGILNVRAGKSRAWKGWTLDQRPDRTPS